MSTYFKHIFVTIALIFTAITGRAADAREIFEAIATEDLPVYVRIIDSEDVLEAARVNDSTFNAIAASTIFIVNRTELNRKDPTLIELTDEVLPTLKARQMRLVGIDLRGGASPEGPYNNNVRLSRGRAKALIDYITDNLDTDVIENLEVTTIAEDYPYLLWILEDMGDSAAPVLRRIIDECGLDRPDLIKKKLQSYHGGKVWARLYKDIFPRLRAARIVLYFCETNRPADKGELMIPTDMVLEMPRTALPEPTGDIRPLEFLGEVLAPRRHMVSVSSNLLYDAFYMPNYGWAPMPNIGVEYYPLAGNWTFRAAFTSPYYHRWDRNQFFQIRDYHLEARRYFNPGRWHTGAYLGAYVNATKYGIGLSKTKGWQGEGIGGAVKLGYMLPLGYGPLRLDFHIAAGMWYTRFDPYVYGNPITGAEDGDYYYDYTGKKDKFIRRNHQLTWFGPTEIGITLTFDVLYHKIK